MNPLLMLLLAVLAPLTLMAALVLPPYAGVYAACALIYAAGDRTAVHALMGKWADPFYMLDVYGQLYSHWRAHMIEADILQYTLPLLVPPAFGAVTAYWLIKRLVQKLLNIFHAATAGH